jgi:hypothetical protein
MTDRDRTVAALGGVSLHQEAQFLPGGRTSPPAGTAPMTTAGFDAVTRLPAAAVTRSTRGSTA